MKTVLPFLIGGSLVAGLLLALAGCGRRVVSMPPGADASAGELDSQAGSAERAKEAFPFPEDRGGQLLAELLPPREILPPLDADRPSGPLPLRAARPIERPEAPIPTAPGEVPRLPPGPSPHLLRPRSIVDEVPLAEYRGEPAPPQALELPAGALVRLPSPDVNLPPPLPMLALPVADRVSLDDPTSEASRQAALAAAPPVRTTHTPFVRLTIPDPFEHARAVRLPTPPVEELPHFVIRRP